MTLVMWIKLIPAVVALALVVAIAVASAGHTLY